MKISMSRATTLALAALSLVLVADPAFAQANVFEEGANWFINDVARGVAMFAVVILGIAAWFFTASLRMVGMIVAGGLIIANVDTIVGWMGF